VHDTHQRFAFAAIGAVVLVVGAASVAPADRVLVAEDTETGERYLTVPVDDETIVAVEYTHSVEKTRVYDEYTVHGDRLEMTSMEFESYGWGLPSDANVTRENGTFVYDPPGNYSSVTVTPGAVAGHNLHVGSNTYNLVARTDENSVDLYVTRRTALAAATATRTP
jgi:hypothetical protein